MPVPDSSPVGPVAFGGQDAYDALSAALADAVLILEEDGTVAYAGPGLVSVLGLDPDAIAGRSILDLVHSDDAVRSEAGGFWNAALPFEREFRIRNGAGAWVWVRAISSAADRDGARPEAVARVLGDRAFLLLRERTGEHPTRDADDLSLRALDAANNLVVVADVRVEDQPLVIVNQGFLEMTGYERDEVVGRNCRFLQVRRDGTRDDAGEGQEKALARIRTVVARGGSASVVLRNYKKDGTLFYNRLYLTPVRDGAGEVTHFVGVQNDVTEEVLQTREAERQRTLLRAFFDSAPFLMGVVTFDGAAVVHRAANEAAAALFRSGDASFDTVEGKTLSDLGFPEAEEETWGRHIKECAVSGEAVHFETRYPWGAAEGDEGVQDLSVVVNGAGGAEPLFSYVAEDVTERRAAERERRLLAAAVEQAAESIIVTGPEADAPGPVILYANRAHQRIFGYEPGELIGQTPRVFQGPKTDRAVLDRIRWSLEAGEGVESETVNYRKDGTEFVLQWEIAPVHDETGEVVNWVGTQRDVTEQRRLEREVSEVAAREQERMARELHDGIAQVLSGSSFKLQALQAQLDRLGHDGLAADLERVREHVTDALRQARAVARGLFPVGIETGGLVEALEQLVADAEEDYGVHCSFTCSAPAAVRSNEVAGHLFRITQEAIANAVRHGHARTLTVSISRVGGDVVLAIHDDGAGIPDGAETAGGGLGLRTMRYRASRVGGRLDVRRRAEGGTTVEVRFDPQAKTVGPA